MYRYLVLGILACCMSFLISGMSFAAQSTDDVSVSEEMKQAERNNLLGDRTAGMVSEKPYVIGHGDILSVSIFGEGDMAAAHIREPGRQEQGTDVIRGAETGVMVMIDGRISLKHIGDVEVVGLTLAELADYLKELYKQVIAEPIVTTTLVQSNSLRYTVMGNVLNPGIFYLDYPLTIVQVVARAGGFTEWASRKVTVVRERVEGQASDIFKGNTMEFDYDRFITGKDIGRNIGVQAGDIIIIK